MNCRFLVLILSLAGAAFAQDRGTIRGVVTDPTGASVPEATVTVKNINTGLTQTVKTSADGVYSVLYDGKGGFPKSRDDRHRCSRSHRHDRGRDPGDRGG